MIRLPRELAPWAAELSLFPEDVALGLGGLVARLALAIGPMRTRAQRGREVPDGYDGLTRRGDYERLLMTEWLLADEMPDEFLRKVAMGEHAFLARAFQEPAASRRSVVFFDAGPDQLGGPRVAHLAALITFARRAADARAELAWGTLAARFAPLVDAVTDAGVLALLEARTRSRAGAADIAEALRRAGRTSAHDELWIVGGAALRDACEGAGVSFVQVDDELAVETHALRVRVKPARGAERTAVLELPPSPVCARLLRDPFQVATARPTTSRVSLATWPGNLVLSLDGRRLFARGADGSLTSLVFGNSPRAVAQAPARFVPPSGHAIVAAGWARGPKRIVVATQSPDGVLHVHTLTKRATAASSTVAFKALGEHAPNGPMSLLYRARDGAHCFHDAAHRLVRLRDGAAGADWVNVIGLNPGSARMESGAIYLGDRVEVVTRDNDGVDVTGVVMDVRVNRVPRVVFGAPPPRWLAAIETAEDTWTLAGGGAKDAMREVWPVPRGLVVCGLVETGWSPRRPSLVVLDAVRSSVSLYRADAMDPIATSAAPIVEVVVNAGASELAFLTEQGEVFIHSLTVGRAGPIARLRSGEP